MNMFDGLVDGDDLIVLDDRGEVAFRLRARRDLVGGRKAIRIGIRPHKIHVADGSAGAARNAGSTVEGDVVSNHWLGDHCHVGVALGGAFLIAVGGRDLAAPSGGRAAVLIPAAAIHLLEHPTGRAISHGLEAA